MILNKDEIKDQLKGKSLFDRDEYVSEEVYTQWANGLSDNILSRKPSFLSEDIDFISIYAMEKLSIEIEFLQEMIEEMIESKNIYLIMDHYLYTNIQLESIRIMASSKRNGKKSFQKNQNLIMDITEEYLKSVKDEYLKEVPGDYLHTDGDKQSLIPFENSFIYKDNHSKEYFNFVTKIVNMIRDGNPKIIRDIGESVLNIQAKAY
jgi:hypothetical protein